MITLTLLVISVIAGIAGLSFGIYLVRNHYSNVRKSYEQKLLQAEIELYEDLKDVSSELALTSAGVKLGKLLMQDEKFGTIWKEILTKDKDFMARTTKTVELVLEGDFSEFSIQDSKILIETMISLLEHNQSVGLPQQNRSVVKNAG